MEIKFTPYEASQPTWGGYIEPADKSWIIWVNKAGVPALYWDERDSDGGVIGEPFQMTGLGS